MKSRRKLERSRETNCNTLFIVQHVLFPWSPFIIIFFLCFVFVSIFVFINLLFCPCYCVCLCHVFVFAFAVIFPWLLSSFYLYLILSLLCLCLCLDRCLILPLSLCLHLGLFIPLTSFPPLILLKLFLPLQWRSWQTSNPSARHCILPLLIQKILRLHSTVLILVHSKRYLSKIFAIGDYTNNTIHI